tara:strand:- start:67 stop:633 length:567 start_codon:yes stop_codon:yes gene_type:complete
MQLQHTFGYDCEGLSSLITNNKLSSFTKKLVELGKKQDPDLYDPLSFMGDGFEWFVEYFFKFFNGDHTLTYTADYEPNYDYDRGIDGRGISTIDGKPNVIQCKFKADPNKYLTNEDNISNVAADATMNEGLQYNGKNVIIVTSCQGVHPKHAMANVHCIGIKEMARRVDNNVVFWDNLRSIVEEQYAN